MNTLGHKVEMEDGDIYLISNTVMPPTSWFLSPRAENYRVPAVRIESEPFPEGHTRYGEVVDIDEYIKPIFDEDLDADDALWENYLQAVHGEFEGWRLIAVFIEKNHVKLMIGKDEENYQYLEVTAAPELQFSTKAPNYRGQITKTTIHIKMEDPNGLDPMKNKAYTWISVVEHDKLYKREFTFHNCAPFDVLYTKAEWIDVKAIEYR